MRQQQNYHSNAIKHKSFMHINDVAHFKKKIEKYCQVSVFYELAQSRIAND